jgi:hypothetical protein
MCTIPSWYATPWRARHWLARAAILAGATGSALAVTALVDSWAEAGLLLAANQLVTPTWVMKEIGRILVNNVKFAANVQRSYDDQYVKAGAKVGFTVNARLPQRYKVNKGAALNPQPVIDNIVPISLTDQANIGIEFSTASLTMEVDNYRDKCIKPAVESLVNSVDSDGLSRMYQATFYTVGTPGTIPAGGSANTTYLDAGVKLDDQAVPAEDRVAVLSPAMHAALANANLAVFNPAPQISEYFRKGQFAAEALGIAEWYKDQNVASHVVGALGGASPQTNGVNQTGSSIATDGWTASVTGLLKKGDVVQFAGVNQINPQNYTSVGVLQDFVVTADVDSNGSGEATIQISPSLLTTTSGALQTVSGAAADNSAVTVFGSATAHASKTTRQGLVYHPEAYALVFADLEMPQGLWVSERIGNKALGIAIRFLKDYSIMTDMSPARVDILYGWKEVRPEMGCRVAS